MITESTCTNGAVCFANLALQDLASFFARMAVVCQATDRSCVLLPVGSKRKTQSTVSPLPPAVAIINHHSRNQAWSIWGETIWSIADAHRLPLSLALCPSPCLPLLFPPESCPPALAPGLWPPPRRVCSFERACAPRCNLPSRM